MADLVTTTSSTTNTEQLWNLFIQCVNCIMSQWTVLNLAIEQGWGGIRSRDKAEQMVLDIIAEFNKVRLVKAKNVERDELEDFLLEFIEQDMNAEAQDGSVEQVSELILTAYKCCATNDLTWVNKLLSSYTPHTAAQCIYQKSQKIPDAITTPTDNTPPIAISINNVEVQPNNTITNMEIEKNNITEDGWTTVLFV